MTINGRPKIFDLSKALIANGDSVVCSSGTTSQNNMLDFDKATYWESIDSDDSTTETITITFNETVELDRLLIVNHNFEDYTVTPVTSGTIDDSDGDPIESDSDYLEDEGGSLIPFINVISLLSSTAQTGISETGYSLNNSYYEFTPIDCIGLVISISKAQELNDLADQEKYCFNVIPTKEIGTFENYPVLSSNDYQVIANQTINRLGRIRKLNPVFSASLNIDVGNSQNDIELLATLDSRENDFIFWANGGKLTENESTSPYYRFSFKPYRLQDFYRCQVVASNLPSFFNNIFSNPISASIQIIETE